MDKKRQRLARHVTVRLRFAFIIESKCILQLTDRGTGINNLETSLLFIFFLSIPPLLTVWFQAFPNFHFFTPMNTYLVNNKTPLTLSSCTKVPVTIGPCTALGAVISPWEGFLVAVQVTHPRLSPSNHRGQLISGWCYNLAPLQINRNNHQHVMYTVIPFIISRSYQSNLTDKPFPLKYSIWST